MKLKRIIFASLGLICFALGTVGVFLPILPTAPFYLATLFFFANSSERLHTWFLGTKLTSKALWKSAVCCCPPRSPSSSR